MPGGGLKYSCRCCMDMTSSLIVVPPILEALYEARSAAKRLRSALRLRQKKKKIRAAMSATPTTDPTAMPAIAPLESEEEEDPPGQTLMSVSAFGSKVACVMENLRLL